MIRIEAGLIFAGYEFDDQVDPFEAGHRLRGQARLRGRLRRQGGADRALGSTRSACSSAWSSRATRPPATATRSGTGAAASASSRAAPAARRCARTSRSAGWPCSTRELGTEVEVGKLDGLQKRIPAQGRALPVLRPRQDAPALVSERSRPPAEFDFPLSWTGPDGIGASPFDEFAEDEAPDVPTCRATTRPWRCARRSGMFATGVTVITTLKGEQVHGMTANAFMSVSLEPPLVLISVDRRTKMCGMLHEGSHYGVSVLCETQSDALRPLRRPPLRRLPRRPASTWSARRRWSTARWPTSWPASSAPTGAATTRCSWAEWSTPATTRARRCCSTAGATSG